MSKSELDNDQLTPEEMKKHIFQALRLPLVENSNNPLIQNYLELKLSSSIIYKTYNYAASLNLSEHDMMICLAYYALIQLDEVFKKLSDAALMRPRVMMISNDGEII